MTALNTDARPPHPLRVVYRQWSGTTWSGWKEMVMAQRINAKAWTNGMRIGPWQRAALPGIGTATLFWSSGSINGRDLADGPDLLRAEIRIQSAAPIPVGSEATASPENLQWVTQWKGEIQQIERNRRNGSATYYAIDTLAAFAQRTPMVSHHYGSSAYATGHPGYNVAASGIYGRKLGNRDATKAPDESLLPTSSYPKDETDTPVNGNWYHTYLGSPNATTWTDYQALLHALHSSRRQRDPVFGLHGSTRLLSNSKMTGAWAITEGQDLWSFINQVLDRRRARGLAFYDWIETNPLKDVVELIRINPQNYDYIKFTDPSNTSSGTSQINGAIHEGTAIDLDFSGDQRLQAGPIIAERGTFQYDRVESYGEPMQVLATLAYLDGNLAKRWTDADATAFNAITNPYWRSTSRWDPVYQRHGLPLTWDWTVKDGNNGTATRLNLVCNDTGTVRLTAPGGESGGNSILGSRILSDLCLFEGYDYSSATLGGTRYDGATDTVSPPRLPPLALGAMGSDQWKDLFRIGFGLNLDEQWGIYLRYGPDQVDSASGRYFGIPGTTPGVVADLNTLALTCTIELSNRVGMATGAIGGRTLRLVNPGIHLWMAAPGAIWKLQRTSSVVADAPAVRNAGIDKGSNGDTTDVRFLRDDRTWLGLAHAFACEWYLTPHYPTTFSIADPYWYAGVSNGGGNTVAPQLGKLINQITVSTTRAAGQPSTATHVIRCPITSVTYDPETNRSDITADWSDLDFRV